MGECPIPGCKGYVPAHLLMCCEHWQYLKDHECARLWRWYKVGVEAMPGLSPNYQKSLDVIVPKVVDRIAAGEAPYYVLSDLQREPMDQLAAQVRGIGYRSA